MKKNEKKSVNFFLISLFLVFGLIFITGCKRKEFIKEDLLETKGPFEDNDAINKSAGSHYLSANEYLYANQYIKSTDGRFTLIMQGDGNLVLYYSGTALWHSSTYGHSGAYLVMQGDGNLVIYKDGTALWHTSTAGQNGAYLEMQNDGNVVIYKDGSALWHTSTGGHSEDVTPIPTTENNLHWTDVTTETEIMYGGASGCDHWVVTVDFSRIHKVKLAENDPYWFKYLRSFWDDYGSH